eukprot:CAMPEP_0205801106 /NCGR_PEP_ID=MMETSP0205-20121125/2984_1 /ASSEMBLY_ACC=CAM_ASM_000278 /TAXON_ID=36767 /ORGANISM="Euplotes focardii, Strain TN1" /LENGTH=204 /DNA_ID=CAMNT_0053065301 /DNA_START=539 /DNA_END=1150 /DNA_ORIENTATION=-
MDNCKLSIWNNTWADQFDFTPKSSGKNYKLIDEDGNHFIDSFKTVTQNIMLLQAQQINPSLDVSQIDLNFEDENAVPLIPITTGTIEREAQCHALVLFLSSDGDTIHQIYEYLFVTYLKGKRDKYWLKETREVQLKNEQLTELLNIDSSDMDYNNRFYDSAKDKTLIGFHLCAASDPNFANEIAGYLSTRHINLEFYLSFNLDA